MSLLVSHDAELKETGAWEGPWQVAAGTATPGNVPAAPPYPRRAAFENVSV
jgi:hypothetical protein